MSDTLRPHGLKHTGSSVLHSPGVCSDPCLLSQWCYLTITSSAFTPPSPFAFSLSQHQGLLQWVNSFASGDQSIGASASATVLPVNIQGWFPLGLTGLTSLPFRGFSSVFSNTTIWKHQFFSAQPSLWPNFFMVLVLYTVSFSILKKISYCKSAFLDLICFKLSCLIFYSEYTRNDFSISSGLIIGISDSVSHKAGVISKLSWERFTSLLT